MFVNGWVLTPGECPLCCKTFKEDEPRKLVFFGYYRGPDGTWGRAARITRGVHEDCKVPESLVALAKRGY